MSLYYAIPTGVSVDQFETLGDAKEYFHNTLCELGPNLGIDQPTSSCLLRNLDPSVSVKNAASETGASRADSEFSEDNGDIAIKFRQPLLDFPTIQALGRRAVAAETACSYLQADLYEQLVSEGRLREEAYELRKNAQELEIENGELKRAALVRSHQASPSDLAVPDEVRILRRDNMILQERLRKAGTEAEALKQKLQSKEWALRESAKSHQKIVNTYVLMLKKAFSLFGPAAAAESTGIGRKPNGEPKFGAPDISAIDGKTCAG